MELKRDQLCTALQSLTPGLASNEIIQQSTHFIFDKDRIYTFNDQIMVAQEFNTGIKGSIGGQTLLKVLQKIPDETITLEPTDDEIIIRGKNKEIGLKLTPASIDIPFSISNTDWYKLPTKFVEGLKLCIISTSRDATKGPLVCIRLKDDQLTSCDNYRLTIYQLDTKFEFTFLLPRTAAEHLIRYSPTLFSSTAEWLHFMNEEKTVFSCRSVADNYPDIGQLLDFKGEWVKFPSGFKDAIERAGLLSTAEFDYERKVQLTLSDGEIECKGEGEDGWFRETNELQYQGDTKSFNIHPTYLGEILSHISKVRLGDDKLLFRGKDFQHVIALAD